MTGAHGDPASIRQLAARIRQSSDELDRVAQSLVSALRSTDWNDPVRIRFERDLNDMVRRVRSFKDPAANAEAYLQKKAQQLDAYLQG